MDSLQSFSKHRASTRSLGPEVYDEPSLLHHIFERVADAHGSNVAIECPDESVSYADLEQQANRIAKHLRKRKIGTEDLVGLCLMKSVRLYAAMLGVLKAGAAYVPIDPELPLARIQQIVASADLALLISEDAFLTDQVTGDLGTRYISLDADAAEIALEPGERCRLDTTDLQPTNACYVIFTSGSTGRPKGVVLEHRNVAAFIAGLHAHYGLTSRDRTYQGFSVGFDASVEEIWAAFSLGGTLVVPPSDIVKSPAEAASFIESRSVTFFSTVPTFLALVEAPLASVRLLVLGGEAASSQLVERWLTPERRVLNTYGPTEAAVVATVADCRADGQISIGVPMKGYACRVLNENLEDVAVGETGELFIGGASIARGYLNMPEKTAEHFLELPEHHPGPGPRRFYRTGDMVVQREDGDLCFVGRRDHQVKIRGYRVELQEIEQVLVTHPSILSAVVGVHERDGFKELASYVVTTEPFGPAELAGVTDLIVRRLPAYMHPKYLDVLQALPTLPNGKADRSALPPPRTPLLLSQRPYAAPEGEIETRLARVWAQFIKADQISADADFFLGLNGDSIVAAHVATALRTEFVTTMISSRDLYKYRTIRNLAQHFVETGISAPDPVSSPPPPETVDVTQAMRVGWAMRWSCALMQALSIVLYYTILSAPLIFFVTSAGRLYRNEMTWADATIGMTVVGFATWPAWLLISVLAKWLVVGRYKAGRYPVWGFYYFRWWFATRFQSIGWADMFIGTPLMSVYFRAMGAKVGGNSYIGTSLCSAFDLVTIGRDVSISADVQLLGYRVEDGWLILGDVAIADECFVGVHSALGLNVSMAKRARLGDMSLLPDGTTLGPDVQCGGSPLIPMEVRFGDEPAVAGRPRRRFLFRLLHLGLIYAMGYFLIASLVPSFALVWYVLNTYGWIEAAASVFMAIPLAIVWYALLAIVVKRMLIGRVRPGVFALETVAYLRLWFLSYLMKNTRHLLLPVYATLFLPIFLRGLGAKIGKGTEISTLMHAVPDLLEIDDGCFLADACIVGGQRIYDGKVDIRANRIGRRTFVGNSAVIPGGVDIGSNSLVGVMSMPPTGTRVVPENTRWLGSPSFELPAHINEFCFAETQTYSPRLRLKLTRIFLDCVRVFLPGVIVSVELIVFAFVVTRLDLGAPAWALYLLTPLFVVQLSLVTLVWAARLKRWLIGTFEPTVRPLWSSFVWVNEIINGVYESVAATALSPLMGTPFLPRLLRKMGCKIGRWVFLDTTLFSEFDLVEIGDYAALNMGCTIQTHLFEDRVLKADYLKIGANCSVGNMAVVLYGSEMKPGSKLAPLSVLMKGETLPVKTAWHGIPNEPDAMAQAA